MKFEKSAEFRDQGPGYRLLPFTFERLTDTEALIVNACGEHLLVDNDILLRLIDHALAKDDPVYDECKAKHILMEGSSSLPVELLATKLRAKYSHLRGFTRLHIFVVTLRCDQLCHYCQVSRVSENQSLFDMSKDTAEQSLDLMFCSPSRRLKLEIQGGEPLLNFRRITHLVESAERRAQQSGKTVDFVVATNLSLITEDMLAFMKDHRVAVSTSLDGPRFIHNANRPHPKGDSYDRTLNGIAMARDRLGPDWVDALMTTTRLSLQYPEEIVDEYERLQFPGVFLRHASPYGFAAKTQFKTACHPVEFLEFYKLALGRILEINRTKRRFVEYYAQIILRKMLTPYSTGYVDLQSPSGLGIGVVVYNYDGNVYASDESRMLAEMGNHDFVLGNVHRDRYSDIFGGSRIRHIVDQGTTESLPGCSECAFLHFCGSNPVENRFVQGDMIGVRPSNDFHIRNHAIISHLFHLLKNGDNDTAAILWDWAVPRDKTTQVHT